jgi:uncharacterized membrane protein YidH (DUF202 family)
MVLLRYIEKMLTPQFRSRFGKFILYVAITSFLIHLLYYFFNTYIFSLHPDRLLESPINAIYTPFSFLLVYEAYLLLYYLPQSTSIYIGKQYEIITLILIRGIFKDITHLNLNEQTGLLSFQDRLWYDLITVIIVFLLTFLFYKISKQSHQLANTSSAELPPQEVKRFINAKKFLSAALIIISIGIGIYAFLNWAAETSAYHDLQSALDINSIFFDQFYTLLIISDVIILLLSLFYTDDYPKIIRNSSFVISTILLKLSFSAEGLLEQLLIIAGVGFGVAMYALSNLFNRIKQA